MKKIFYPFLLALAPAAMAATWSVDFRAEGGGVAVAANVETAPGEAVRRADGLLRRIVLDRSRVSGLGGAFKPGDELSLAFVETPADCVAQIAGNRPCERGYRTFRPLARPLPHAFDDGDAAGRLGRFFLPEPALR